MLQVLHSLSSTTLRELASLCRQTDPDLPQSIHALQQIAGVRVANDVGTCMRNLAEQHWRGQQAAVLLDALANVRGQTIDMGNALDLVLSGPDVAGVPTRDTAAVMHALIEDAREEVLLVGYAVHDGKRLFEPLVRKLASQPGLRVWFCLDISRRQGDASLASEIVRRFAHEFSAKHWPWEPKPEVYYDPRSLDDGRTRSSMHAKCVIVDRKAAFITSANFTEAAQQRNVEAGVIVNCASLAGRAADYFGGLVATGSLSRCQLPSKE